MNARDENKTLHALEVQSSMPVFFFKKEAFFENIFFKKKYKQIKKETTQDLQL